MNFVDPITDSHMVQMIKNDLRARGEKYFIMFLVGISLGLRVNEILGLRVGDVKDKKETVFRQKKTGKEIAVAFNSELSRELRHYCEYRDPHEALIPNRNNEYKPIGRIWAYKVLRSVCAERGISQVGTHTMRKTCGYHFYKQTNDIGTLQVWFNHSSERETLRYIGVTRESIKKAMINFKI